MRALTFASAARRARDGALLRTSMYDIAGTLRRLATTVDADVRDGISRRCADAEHETAVTPQLATLAGKCVAMTSHDMPTWNGEGVVQQRHLSINREAARPPVPR